MNMPKGKKNTKSEAKAAPAAAPEGEVKAKNEKSKHEKFKMRCDQASAQLEKAIGYLEQARGYLPKVKAVPIPETSKVAVSSGMTNLSDILDDMVGDGENKALGSLWDVFDRISEVQTLMSGEGGFAL